MRQMQLTILVLALVAGHALAQDEAPRDFDDRWYVGLSGGVAELGSDRNTDSNAGYFGVYLGRFFSPNFSLDFQLDGYPTELDRDDFVSNPGAFPADDDFEIYGYGVTGRWHLGSSEQRHRPYGLVGLGIAEHDNAFDDGRDMYVSFGGGLRSQLTDRLHFRTQLEGRYDNDRDTFPRDNGFIDFIASVGLGWSFGGARNAAPAPAATQAPPPEPVAAPEPPRPMPPQRPAPAPQVAFEFDATVLFAFDSAALRDEARAELDAAARALAPRDDLILIEVAGHTDNIGTDEYNQDLSERRARAVADYLAANGVDQDRMRVVGFGESQPKVPNTTPANRQQNRRVVISTVDRR